MGIVDRWNKGTRMFVWFALNAQELSTMLVLFLESSVQRVVIFWCQLRTFSILVSIFHWILFIFLQESELIARLEERLALVSDGARRGLRSDVVCDVCHTPVTRLKQEAIAMVQSLERAQADSPIPASHIPTYLGGSKSVAARSMPRTTPHYSSTHHRYVQLKYFRVAILRQWRIWGGREPYPHYCKNKSRRKWLPKGSYPPPLLPTEFLDQSV